MRHCAGFLGALLIGSLVGCAGDEPADGPGEEVADAVPLLGAAVPVPPVAQAISFLGDTLLPVSLTDAQKEVYLARYAEAEDVLAANPEDVDALIWMGRRTAYLGQYREAIDIYTYAMTLHPDDARLYRHRGHRYISVRELDNAIADFERAAALFAGEPDEVEPDGLPNARGIPTSSLQYNTWYHLGLAHYMRGDFEAALAAYEAGQEVSTNPDAVVATSYWHYMTLRRLGRDSEAADVLARITPDMGVFENTAYLNVLLLYTGDTTLEDLLGDSEITQNSTTLSYGVGVFHLLNGREAEAYETFERTRDGIVAQWPVFGFVAAEAELARRKSKGSS
jgi:tetratricopeptide (TPR) repeat protein